MIVPQAQIVTKSKIGESDSGDLTYIRTVGGLHMIVNRQGHVVSAGPHKAVAKHIASRHVNGVVWTELSKSDHMPLEAYQHLLPEYEALTSELRKAQGV